MPDRGADFRADGSIVRKKLFKQLQNIIFAQQTSTTNSIAQNDKTMIQSMTGFGRGCASSSSKKITVEIKSLNSKQFDAAARIPHIFREYDIEIRSRVAKALERGKVDICVAVESTATETTSTVNVDILSLYKSQLEEMGKKLGLPEPADWYSLLMHMPDAMKSEQQAAAADDYAALIEACGDAIATLREFRLQEGRKLYDFFRSKIENIGSLLVEIEPYEAERVPKIKMRLEEQLERLSSIEYDAGRLEQEMIFYIEKLDVNEEKLRLRSHLNYFLETLGGEELPKEGQGKKLGFIAQEMGREINTLGSKSNNADMQKIVVRMKDELEQIKEQVLNVL